MPAVVRAASSVPAAPSPFADPALQDTEVPYENLPVDKGHLLPPPEEEEEEEAPEVHSLPLWTPSKVSFRKAD